MDTTLHYLVKPVLTGGVAAAISSTLHPGIGIQAGGSTYSLPKFTFAAVAAGAVLSEAMHDYVYPHILKQNKMMTEPVTEAAAIGTIFATNAALHYMANPSSIGEIGLIELLAESAAAEVISSFTFDKLVYPMVASWSQ